MRNSVDIEVAGEFLKQMAEALESYESLSLYYSISEGLVLGEKTFKQENVDLGRSAREALQKFKEWK